MGKERTGFLLELDKKDVVDNLSDEEAGQLIKAIYQYECSPERKIPTMDKMVKMVFLSFKGRLDKNEEKYKETCLKNKENIDNYWKKVREEKDTSEYERIQSNTMATNKKKLNEIKLNETKLNKTKSNNKININNSEGENNNVANAPTPPHFDFSSIVEYGKELEVNEEYCERFYNHYESIGWVNGNGQQIKNWKLVFNNWVKEDKNKKETSKPKRRVF
jgi:hypothetical protein